MSTTAVKLDSITTLPKLAGRVALVGTPNSGKSTLFNQLTGLRQKTANYPGVTVEKKTGRTVADNVMLDLIDLPGLYSLTPDSLDEQITSDVLLGYRDDTPISGICAVIDATRLQQGLFLLRQLLDLNLPMVVALTMTDSMEKQGSGFDSRHLSTLLGDIVVVPVVANTGKNLNALRAALGALSNAPDNQQQPTWPELSQAVEQLQSSYPEHTPAQIQRLLCNQQATDGNLLEKQQQLFGEQPPAAAEARYGHQWASDIRAQLTQQGSGTLSTSRRITRFLEHPAIATGLFFVVMFLIFQAVFFWATPLMDGIDGSFSALSDWLSSVLPEGIGSSLLIDGVIAGVGSVLIFLPQILFLFFFIILLEDSGFLARSAFLMDRAMRSVGLSGHSMIPLVASFACAVPAIMATRVINSPRQRIATILAAPFITCSARLPVYALLIGAFVPANTIAGFNQQGLVLFGLYMLGIIGAGFTSWLANRIIKRQSSTHFAMSLPEFRLPNWRTVLLQLMDRCRVFLRRAGRVIFLVTVIVWALAYFPHTPISDQIVNPTAAELSQTDIENQQSAAQLENSYLGKIGKTLAPMFKPLGWDWKVSAAVIAGFPAREIMVAVLGTIYAVGDSADDQTLAERLRSARWADGRATYSLPMVIGLLVFYALCLQCAATIAVMRRETNGWKWPMIAWGYMTGLGYLSALLIYQLFS